MEHPKPKQLKFSCGICRKKLTSKQNLLQHVTTHTGEKPLKCTYEGCAASFKHASQLSTHKANHVKNLPDRLDFTDFKNFIFMFLEFFGNEPLKEFRGSTGPYGVSDAHLPGIGVQKMVKLPRFEKLIHE